MSRRWHFASVDEQDAKARLCRALEDGPLSRVAMTKKAAGGEFVELSLTRAIPRCVEEGLIEKRPGGVYRLTQFGRLNLDARDAFIGDVG